MLDTGRGHSDRREAVGWLLLTAFGQSESFAFRQCPAEGDGIRCVSGWHLRWHNGFKIAIERCRGAQHKPPDSRYTFESFDATREPAAYDAMLRVANEESLRVALIPSGHMAMVGCGKTHLLRAAMAKLQAEGSWCVYVDGDLKRHEQSNLMRCDALFVDHLGREPLTDAQDTARLLAALLDQRRLITVLASSMPMMQLRARYGPEVASRIEGMERPLLVGGDYRTAGALLSG